MLDKEHSSRFDVNPALNTEAERFPQETRSCGTVENIRRWRFSAWVSHLRLRRLRRAEDMALPVTATVAPVTATVAAATPVTVAAAVTVTPAAVAALTARTVPHRLTPGFTATAG